MNQPEFTAIKKQIGERKVSTMPLGPFHAMIVNANEFFETMVFSTMDGDEWDLFQTRYPDAIAAAKGHERVIKLIEAGSSPDEF